MGAEVNNDPTFSLQEGQYQSNSAGVNGNEFSIDSSQPSSLVPHGEDPQINHVAVQSFAEYQPGPAPRSLARRASVDFSDAALVATSDVAFAKWVKAEAAQVEQDIEIEREQKRRDDDWQQTNQLQA